MMIFRIPHITGNHTNRYRLQSVNYFLIDTSLIVLIFSQRDSLLRYDLRLAQHTIAALDSAHP